MRYAVTLRAGVVQSRLPHAGVDRQAIPRIPRPISREGLHALLAAAW